MCESVVVHEALAQLDAAVSSCLDVSAWALPQDDLVAFLEGLHAQLRRVAAAELGVVREVDGQGVAKAHGATSTAVWLRNRLRMGLGQARTLVLLASTLDTGPVVLREALAAGEISLEQAEVIAAALDTVPDKAGPEVLAEAAGVLVGWAGQFEPAALGKLGDRILFHVAPGLAEEAERAAMDNAEKRSREQRHLTWSHQSNGTVRLTGLLDAETAAVLHAAVDPLCTPNGVGDPRSPGQRRVDALAEVCRLALNTTELPENGGDRPQIVVTTDYDVLTGQLGAGTLDTGLRLTPETVRRLACDAHILPAVLGSASQVMDVGRQQRLIIGPVRRALNLRDGGCAFPGCDRPPRWAEGHHIKHWADGGVTALHNAVLLCGHHHRLVHHDDWEVRVAADGLPDFIPPAWLDPEQVPRRNTYHRRQ